MRVLVPPGTASVGRRITLDENEAHHLRVRRAREDESVEVVDGAGLSGTGRLSRAGAEWSVEIQSAARRAALPELILAVGAGDRERFTWMAEKAVELGVTRIIPLETAHSAGVGSRLKQAHLEKLTRVLLETTKQCGATWAPALESPVELAEFVGRTRTGAGWLADPAGEAPPAALDGSPVTILVGPEGGFTADERAAITAAGYRPVALGGHTLRFETAAIAAASVASAARARSTHG
jgi:16S rRNA (uracil1498-N3)-methyltransferase